MKTKLKMHGIDADNGISLLEYGLLISDEPHKDGSGSHFAVYNSYGDKFDTGRVYPNDIDKLINGQGWATETDITSFLSFVGNTKKDWLELPLVHKLHDVIQFWGADNIMGSSYYLMEAEEVIEEYLT